MRLQFFNSAVIANSKMDYYCNCQVTYLCRVTDQKPKAVSILTTASEQNTKTRFYLTLIHLSISKGGGGASINSHFMFSSNPIHTCFAGSMKSMLDYFTHSGILKAYNKNQL